MKIISKANEAILQMIKPFFRVGTDLRWLRYCIISPCSDGQLVFNLMTREMILLSNEEYADCFSNQYLLDHWFIVPQQTCEKNYVDIIKLFIKKKQPNFQQITHYSVFTTTDCNARCFYCYEAGCKKTTMESEVCEKIVQYIKSHSGGRQVRINWFGGEPLLNTKAIDTICNGLMAEGIPYTSKMITNGYLLNDTNVQKAVTRWNLKEIQITLDGTEDVYNKVKDYIYTDGNPYEIVLGNIKRLADAGILPSIRLNLDLYNADDLLKLADDLASRFTRGQIYVYVHKLFQETTDYNDQVAADACAKLEAAVRKVEAKLKVNGLKPPQGIPKIYKVNYCMADCGHAITFLPTGDIGLCEVFTESEFIGHIDREGFDQTVISDWRETTEEIPACADCFYFPECYKLKKCASCSTCYPAYQDAKKLQLQEQMQNEYQMSKYKK